MLIELTFRLRLIPFAVIALLLSIPLAVSAQVTTATMVGTVTDPGGSKVPGAQVTARGIDTGSSRTVTTNDEGDYRIEFLPIGKYTVEVSYTGFKKALLSDVVLQVNETARVDVALSVGQVSETVTISEMATPAVNTSTSEIARTIQSAEISSLPLVERNVYTLLDLTPGVQSNNNGVATASTGTSTFILGYPEQRTLINGGTDGGTGSVNYYLDGGINMTNLRNTGNILPNPDAIQEFKVQTNSYNAEYGRYASGVINVVTKSGTNQFHGSAFEFLRNTVFNANDWGSTLARAPFHRNQFGGTIGGPIKKDKAFFFASYSGLRQATSTFLSGARVPTALERIGNFTASATKPTDPATNAPFVCNGVTNVICPNRQDAVALKIINDFIPTSNITLSNGNAGWQGNIATPYNFDEYLGKVDYQLNEAHRLNVSYFNTGGTSRTRGGSGNLPWSFQDSTWRQHSVNVSDVWILSSNKINQAWLTFSRNFGGRINSPATSLTDLGSAFTIQGTPNLPQITVTGYFTLGQQIGGPTAGTNFYSGRDVFSWIKGKHSLKLGGEISLNKDIQQTLLNNYGVFTFNANSTARVAGGGVTAAAGNAFADFLIGIPSAVSQDAPVTGYTNTWYTALFVQDDFKAHPRVTLNLGLRWDVQTAPTDPLNRVVNYEPGKKSVVIPTAPVGALFFGDPGVERAGIPTSYTHFSPRIGFAWDVAGDGKTSIRGAAGLFYGSISGNEWNTMTNFQPFSTRLTFTNINQKTNAAGVPLGATLINPYNAFVGGNPFPYKGTFTTGGGLFPVASDFEWPFTFQMNIGVQRQLTRDLVVGAAYVDTEAHNLPFARDINYPVLTSTATTAGANILARRPNPLFGAILELDSDQDASYHGLQITSAMRMSHHVTFNAFYTLSKTNSTVQLYNSTTQGGAQNFSKLYEDYGAGDTDQRHVFSMSMTYKPDYFSKDSNAVLRHVFNGWSLSPIVKIRSGLPFTVTNGNVDANLDGNTSDRAQLIGDPHLDNPTAARWFNTAAFAQNPVVTGVATDGTSPRNFLYGPGYWTVDLGLSRDFHLTERVGLRFRAEATNAFNHVNLGQPNASVPANVATSTTFGVISSAGAMRRMQFGLRLTF
ncbi:MAG TPA: carboxypeptidase regulatory-like domain-containing protein [Pyrinomonadaceae bacterium]|nr:carboxypeptidase regulatory-like domain-containing protein [Pyrinomonadaceae bacterium]